MKEIQNRELMYEVFKQESIARGKQYHELKQAAKILAPILSEWKDNIDLSPLENKAIYRLLSESNY